MEQTLHTLAGDCKLWKFEQDDLALTSFWNENLSLRYEAKNDVVHFGPVPIVRWFLHSEGQKEEGAMWVGGQTV